MRCVQKKLLLKNKNKKLQLLIVYCCSKQKPLCQTVLSHLSAIVGSLLVQLLVLRIKTLLSCVLYRVDVKEKINKNYNGFNFINYSYGLRKVLMWLSLILVG